MAGTKAVSLVDAETAVIGMLSAIVVPAYQVASSACKGERLLRDDGLAVCRSVASSLLNGDTIITEMVGASIAQRAWPENSPQWVAAAEARQRWDYTLQFGGEMEVWLRTNASDYLALCERHRREQDVHAAALTAMGKNPNPSPTGQQ
jgi:hypothetical protein